MSHKNPPGPPPPERRCQARSKRTGAQCGKWAMRGRDVCRAHGGATPRGIGAGRFEHGRYSKSIPSKLSQSYAEILGDSKRLELDNELAVVVARSREILAGLDGGDSGPWRLRLRRHKRAAEKARRDGDAGAAAERLNAIMRMIEEGAPGGEVWQEWRDNAAQLQRLAESERKRRVEDQQIATTEEVLGLMAAVLSAVMRHVTDEKTRRVLTRELDSLAGWPEDGDVGRN